MTHGGEVQQIGTDIRKDKERQRPTQGQGEGCNKDDFSVQFKRLNCLLIEEELGLGVSGWG